MLSFKPQVMPTNKPEQAMLKIKYSISSYFTHFKKNRKCIIKVTDKKSRHVKCAESFATMIKMPSSASSFLKKRR